VRWEIVLLRELDSVNYSIIYVYTADKRIELDRYELHIPTLISNDFYLFIRTHINNMGIILFGCLDAEPHFSCTLFGHESEIDTSSLEKRSIIISLYVGIHIAQKHVGLDTRTRCTHS